MNGPPDARPSGVDDNYLYALFQQYKFLTEHLKAVPDDDPTVDAVLWQRSRVLQKIQKVRKHIEEVCKG